MSTHTPTNYGGVPLNDVEMEDLSDITSALLDAIPSREPDEACEDVQVVASASTIPLAAPASNTENYTSEELHNINNTATQAPPSTEPTKRNNPTEDYAAARLRHEKLASLFANTTVELKNLAPPPVCNRYPEHANEILEAYLEQTTFTVNIWTNFDAAEQVFFEGARATDCGKLQLPKKKLEWLLGLDRDRYELDHVRLDIGTPFRTLARIFLHVHYDDEGAFLEVKGTMVTQNPPRGLHALRDFLKTCIRRIEEAGSNRSLDADDLVGIASLFRRHRYVDEDDGEWEQPQYGGGEWAGIEEPPLLLRNSSWAV